MKTIIECLSGDLYPTGDLRYSIHLNRSEVRDEYKKAPPVVIPQWDLELFDHSIKIGDYVQVGDKKPFQIVEISYKHIVGSTFETTLKGEKSSFKFKDFGNTPIKILREV